MSSNEKMVPERLAAPDVSTGHPAAGREFATAFYKERARADALAGILAQKSEQPHGQPVALPGRQVFIVGETTLSHTEGWNACLEEIAKLGPLYTRPVQGEPAAWSPVKPSTPGAYWVRGNGLDQDALIQVIDDQGELRCNLHQRTTEADFGWGYAVSDLSEEFEWLGPLYTHADPGEIESLKADKQAFAQNAVDLRAEVERLRRLFEQSEKTIDRIHCMYGKRLLDLTGQPQTVLIPDEEFVKYFEEIKSLSAQLAERDALLRQSKGLLKVSAERLPRKHQTIRAHISQFLDGIDDALSASAQPNSHGGSHG